MIHNKESRPSQLMQYINFKLKSMGLPNLSQGETTEFDMTSPLIESFQEKNRLLSAYLCPCDQRIQAFLDDHLKDLDISEVPRLPSNTFILDQPGMARELSFAPDNDQFFSETMSSYRIKQGVLHNPKNDRRTTKGVFHVTEGGLPVPHDKKAVPKKTFAYLLQNALNPPASLKELPFTSSQQDKASCFVSLLIKPMVCPEVPGLYQKKNMEIRFFAPGNLVCSLDFVESIFGNQGDPNLPINDSGLDVEHWSGHTGCVILAPHLPKLLKKDIGLPYIEDATDGQRRDGMCWQEKDELYNDGLPFKITCRDEKGVMVTIIADSYFGYCKKEVKTQISYAANLFGLSEEEHAGGALVFPSYSLGDTFIPRTVRNENVHDFQNTLNCLGDRAKVFPEGYAVDKNYPDIIYIPESARMFLNSQLVMWQNQGKTETLPILPEKIYVHPSGYKVRIEKHPGAPSWRLVGTEAEGTLCHKPCTVSGGGKSEISKSIWDGIHFGPFFVADFEKDLAAAENVINHDYLNRYIVRKDPNAESRGFFSEARSMGSVIKMLTPSSQYTQEYNDWLGTIPDRVRSLVFLIKRFYQPEWKDNWRQHFSVDFINGSLGNELKLKGRKIVASYLRVGIEDETKAWRIFQLRQDYLPAEKVQWEDDISSSIVVPSAKLTNLNPVYKHSSVRIVNNCENYFFQRPDDAIIRGYDKQAEIDLAKNNNFICNFEPLDHEKAKALLDKTVSFHAYTEPIKNLIHSVVEENKEQFFISSSHPRLVDGKPTKNPRYLQFRPDIEKPQGRYLAEVGTRLSRKIPAQDPVIFPVNAVLPGRRNNPADPENKIRPLAVYNPIHYQELPELFMDYVCSLTGKSPSTTGAGSEGALTKGPFNALVTTTDLNNALLSYILTGYNGFSTAAGYIGTKYNIQHDISLLVPELWSRLSEKERDPQYLIENGYLESIKDFEYEGRLIPASRLGYRITSEFMQSFLGRIFNAPRSVFPDDMLKPELQNREQFVDGILNIAEAQEKVAKGYLESGSIDSTIPPLKAILYIMANGSYEGKTIDDPEIRSLFNRHQVLQSDWYKERLEHKKQIDLQRFKKFDNYVKTIAAQTNHHNKQVLNLIGKGTQQIEFQQQKLESSNYIDHLTGTIGADILPK